MGKTATGGQVSAPIFANFMKMALADKKPVPFREPPGIRKVRVSAKTGLRANPGEADAVVEYFKPFEEPDDPNSFLGYESAAETTSSQSPAPTGRSISQGRPTGLY
jgi:penicillin-binding protein 1A